MDSSFSDWLREILDVRGWSQSDLARRADISRQVISRYINQTRTKPDEIVLRKIANAFDLPAIFVFQKAGLLPEEDDISLISEGIAFYKFGELTQEQKDEVIRFIEWVQDRDDPQKKRTGYLVEKYTREGEAPPEAIK